MNKPTAALLSIGAVAGAGLIGAQFGPQHPREAIWYASLRKPGYTPPGPAIGAAWGVLETLLCVTGYRLLTRRDNSSARTSALVGWGATLAGLAGFQPLFFGAKRLGPSTGASAAMVASTASTAAAAARIDPLASAAMILLVAWTTFATLLSEEIWRRN